METIKTRFTDLRQTAEQVQEFIREKLDWQDSLGLHTAIEDDFGLAGLDTEELLIEFGDKFKVDLSQFDFTGYISPEPGLDSGMLLTLVLLLIYLPLFLVAWVIKLLLATTCLFFSRRKAKKYFSMKIGFPTFIIPEHTTHKVLRIGDLVASAAAGRFVKREEVRFELIPSAAI